MEQKKTTDEKDELGIVSVNKRTGTPGQAAGKLVFLVVVGSVLVIGLLMGMNQWRATRTAEAAQEEQAAKVENKPAQVGPKRIFDQDPVYHPHKGNSTTGKGKSHASSLQPGMIVAGLEQGLNENGRPMPLGQGTGGGRPSGTARSSRFGGEAILAGTNQPTAPATQHPQAAGAEAAITLVRDLLGTPRGSESMDQAGAMLGGPNSIPLGDQSSSAFDPGQAGPGGAYGMPPGVRGIGMPLPPGPAPSGAGTIGGLLTPSSTPKVEAGMIGGHRPVFPELRGRAGQPAR